MQNTTKRINVARGRGRFTPYLLGAHRRGRADRLAIVANPCLFAVTMNLSEAKIDNLGPRPTTNIEIDNDVAGFEVAMNHPPTMCMTKARRDL